ncbi:MAG: diacylglycerol/lipid kinase family protein [Bacillota bacterium]
MRSYKFIVNPIAGGGRARALMPKIEKKFKEAGVEFDIYVTKGREDAIEAAANAASEGFEVIVAVGGDGTVNEVLNGIVHTDTVLAALHGGKGNDFATAVNMPRDLDHACAALLRASIKSIDLGKVLDRYFINSVGVGFDAAVALRANQGVKPFKGVSAYIYSFFSILYSYEPVEMLIDLGKGPEQITPLLVAVGIGTAYGGGMKIVPDAIQDDGLFDVCVMDVMNRLSLVYHFPKVFSGALKNIEQTTMYRTSEVKLSLSQARPLHLEGEILLGDNLHFTLEPKGMKVLFCDDSDNIKVKSLT